MRSRVEKSDMKNAHLDCGGLESDPGHLGGGPTDRQTDRQWQRLGRVIEADMTMSRFCQLLVITFTCDTRRNLLDSAAASVREKTRQ